MPVSELLAAVPPPRNPIFNVGDWHAAEAAVGAEFPADFRDFIAHYGAGEFFRGHLRVYNPLTDEGVACIKKDQEIYRSWSEGLRSPPFAVHPDKPGLLPWGSDDCGGSYCWLTEGTPERWPVVFLPHEFEDKPHPFSMDITGFLAAYAANQFEAQIHPDDPFSEDQRVFTPGRTQADVYRELQKIDDLQ